MRILVTGGAGFIGSNLLHYWSSAHPDDELICLDLLTYSGHFESIRKLADSGSIRFVKGDIRDRDAVRSAIRDADAVIHLAAESHVDRSIARSDDFVTTNVLGTQVLLEEARHADTGRFHHVSTDEVFGSLEIGTTARFTEDTPYNPSSPYAASKAGADHLVRSYITTYGLRATITNCGNNYGPYQHPEKLIPRFVTLLLSGRKVPLYGDGLNIRDWIHVTDHCSAIDTVLHKGSPGATYLVSGRNELSNREITEKLLELTGAGREMVELVKDRPGHDRRYAIDDTRIRTELGWAPSMTFDAGLSQTVQWYKRNTSWWKPLTD